MNIDGYILIKLSGSNPEHYSVFLNENLVGVLKLCERSFLAVCPNWLEGETVYSSTTIGKGMFTVGERMDQLTAAIEQIKLWVETTPGETAK